MQTQYDVLLEAYKKSAQFQKTEVKTVQILFKFIFVKTMVVVKSLFFPFLLIFLEKCFF